MTPKKSTSIRLAITLFVIVLTFMVGRMTAPHQRNNDAFANFNTEVVTTTETDIDQRSFLLEEFADEQVILRATIPNNSQAKPRNAKEAESLREQLIAWSKTHPLDALSFAAKQLNPLPQRELAITAILAEWASREPEQAWEWAQENSRNDLVGLLSEIAKVDPEMAWENANKHTQQHPEDTYVGYLSTLSGITYSGDYAKGVEFIDSLDLPYTAITKNGKHTFILPIVSEWVRFSPEKVVDWIRSLPDAHDSAKKSLAHEALILSWSYSDPIATLEYSLELPENLAKTSALTNSIHHLIDIGEVTKAAEWLNEHGQGPEYDKLIRDMATRTDVMGENTDLAIDWASSIIDPRVREDGLVNIAADLLAKDPEKAKEYFEDKDLLSVEAWALAEAYAIERSGNIEDPEDYGNSEQYN